MVARSKNQTAAHVGIGERLILASLALALALLVGLVGAPDKWLTAIFCTIPTFAGMIDYSRSRMQPKILWATMSCAFVLHLLLIWLVFGILLRSKNDVGFFICLPGILVEIFVLYHFVTFIERRLMQTRSRHD